MNMKLTKKMMLVFGLATITTTPMLLAVSCSSVVDKNFVKVVEEAFGTHGETYIGQNVMVKKSSIRAFEKLARPTILEGYSWFNDKNTWRIETENADSYIYNEAIIKLNEYVESPDVLKPIFEINYLNDNNSNYRTEFNPSFETKRSEASILDALDPKNWLINSSVEYQGIKLYTELCTDINPNFKIRISESISQQGKAPTIYVPVKVSLEGSLASKENSRKISRIYWASFDDFSPVVKPDDILKTMNKKDIRFNNQLLHPSYNNQAPTASPDELERIFIDAITENYPILKWKSDLLEYPEVQITNYTWAKFYPDFSISPVYGYTVNFAIKNTKGISSTKSINIYYGW